MSELEDIEARMLEIQREYIRKSAGLDSSRLRDVEESAEVELRRLRARRARLLKNDTAKR